MIGDEDRERVREATDFVSLVGETVQLRERSSGDFWGCCPFHHEKSPSFHVKADTGFWYCFGCGEGGDVFNYVQKREGLDFPDAIRYLADRAGIELHETGHANRGPKRGRLNLCLQEAERFYANQLLRVRGPAQDSARAYCAGRSMGAEVCKRWGLGFAPGHGQLVRHLGSLGFTSQEMLAADLAVQRSGRLADRFYDRVMFPIHDEAGRSIGMGGRVMGDGKPKYLNSKDSAVWHKSKHLFAFDRAKEPAVASGEIVIVEGYTDTIALHEAGFTNVAAVLGTALTIDHIKLINRLKPKRIVVMLDGDAAGQRAAEKTVRFVDKTEADLLCVTLPDDADPAEYLEAHGAAALRDRLAEARPLIDVVLERHLDGAGSMGPGRRVRAMEEVASILAPLKDSILIDGYARRVADALGTSAEEALRRIRAAEVPAEGERVSQASRHDVPDEVPYASYGPDYGPAPEPDYGPWDTQTLPPRDPASELEATVERELLGAMVAHPDAFGGQAARIASITWSDPRHEAIAWAVLGLPPQSSPADAARAATDAVPEAPALLSGASIDVVSNEAPESKVAFLVDNVELFSVRRRSRAIQARLSSPGPDDDVRSLMQEVMDLGAREASLKMSLAGEG